MPCAHGDPATHDRSSLVSLLALRPPLERSALSSLSPLPYLVTYVLRALGWTARVVRIDPVAALCDLCHVRSSPPRRCDVWRAWTRIATDPCAHWSLRPLRGGARQQTRVHESRSERGREGPYAPAWTPFAHTHPAARRADLMTMTMMGLPLPCLCRPRLLRQLPLGAPPARQ